HVCVVLTEPANSNTLVIQPRHRVIPVIIPAAYHFPACSVFRFPHVFRKPLLQAPGPWYPDWVPHPTVIEDADAVWADVQCPVEIIEIMNRTVLASLITCWISNRQQLSGVRIRQIQAIPGGAMNRDKPSPDEGKREREGNRFRVIIAAIECERYLA